MIGWIAYVQSFECIHDCDGSESESHRNDSGSSKQDDQDCRIISRWILSWWIFCCGHVHEIIDYSIKFVLLSVKIRIFVWST